MTFQILTAAYEEETLFYAQVLEWQKRFSGERDSVEEEERAENPRSATTDQNIAKIHDMIEEVQTKTENLLKGLPNTCYQQWQHQMQKSMNAEENYFEVEYKTHAPEFDESRIPIDRNEKSHGTRKGLLDGAGGRTRPSPRVRLDGGTVWVIQ
ncbi:hypothetical protein TNCV_1381771 [Trichonephila clavipes]|nr:hypothetical protein TNCV_1381771 [Trichonephila clavipes]